MSATKLRVYRGGVPPHVQVHVRSDQVVGDHLDDEDRLVSTAIYDKDSVEGIAKARGLELINVGLTAQEITEVPEEVLPNDVDPNDAVPESWHEPVWSSSEDDATEVPLADRNVDELRDIASTLEIEGRSGMNKAALVEAIEAYYANEEE